MFPLRHLKTPRQIKAQGFVTAVDLLKEIVKFVFVLEVVVFVQVLADELDGALQEASRGGIEGFVIGVELAGEVIENQAQQV
jgi:hypothetical protein